MAPDDVLLFRRQLKVLHGVFQRGPRMRRAVLVVAVSRLLNIVEIVVVQKRADREHFLINPEMQFFSQAKAHFGNLNAVFQRVAAAVLRVALHFPDLRITLLQAFQKKNRRQSRRWRERAPRENQPA